MQSNASPRPWRGEGRDAIYDANGRLVAVMYLYLTPEDQERRDLIVTAVNAFQAMRDALEAARHGFNCGKVSCRQCDVALAKITAALAKTGDANAANLPTG